MTLLFPGLHKHLFKFPSHLSLEQRAPRLGEFVRQKTASCNLSERFVNKEGHPLRDMP